MKKLIITIGILIYVAAVFADERNVPPPGTRVNSVAYEASRVLKSSSGILIGLNVYNSKASAQFIQLFDSTTVPADTAVPAMTMTVAATSNVTFNFPITGIPFQTGIAVSNSSTGPTKTIGSADCYFTAVVRNLP